LDGLGGDPSGGLQAVHVRHAHVHQHDLGQEPAGELDRLGAVAGFPYHLHVGLGVDHHAEPGSHQRLVVGDENSDRHDVGVRGQV
jgi:hypothetical protein